ncbi:universal stress protein [uncultured Georgenia sp.]|uniref:universal stress protein n=1 Tax=uncultured Georgenia sp. TaxID=378209 RepID=UPI002633875E|nr:universal stress protein [uncultured Georgenia sp.]HLV04109.1 universal stress protein [Actinomycetaceae bacterium]
MTIVLGYVPTPEGRAALAAAVEEARLRAERLVVLNTTRADRLVDPRYAHDSDIAELEEVLRGAGVDHELRHHTSAQLAGDELVALAGELDATMLVIGLRHRSPVGKLLLGSAAQTVLLDAPCPVLAVKAPER